MRDKPLPDIVYSIGFAFVVGVGMLIVYTLLTGTISD